MSKQYKVLPPAPVAGVEPGGTVTREQVEAFHGPTGHVNFDALVGVHLAPAEDEAAPTAKVKAEAKKP